MILYKYYPPEGIVALEKGTLAFTPPKFFNDPYEILPKVVHDYSEKIEQLSIFSTKRSYEMRKRVFSESDKKPSKKAFRRLVQKERETFTNRMKTELQKFPNKMASEMNELISREYGILCMSKIWDSHLMWGHYAKGFTGFCVGYEMPTKLLEKFEAIRVCYTDDRVAISGKSILDQKLQDGIIGKIIGNKFSDWMYESEVRYVVNLDLLTPNVKQDQFYLEHPSNIVTEVYVGQKASDPDKNRIKEALVTRSMRPTVYKIDIDAEEYRLVRCEM